MAFERSAHGFPSRSYHPAVPFPAQGVNETRAPTETGCQQWLGLSNTCRCAAEMRLSPLHLDNLSRRVIRPAVRYLWHGWHAFRRGVLFDLGVPVETASLLARHANVAITQEHYLMLKSRKQGRAAMRKLGSKVRRMLDTKNRKSRSDQRQ
jgi:hypothetical protein